MSNIRTILEANDKLESPSVNNEGLMEEASTIVGEELDRAGLEKATETFWAKVAGFITFVNIIWVTAAIIGVIAICWLCGLYLISILKAITPPVYEVLIYAVCFGAIVGVWWLPKSCWPCPAVLVYIASLVFDKPFGRVTKQEVACVSGYLRRHKIRVSVASTTGFNHRRFVEWSLFC